jgi:hypothetical protein
MKINLSKSQWEKIGQSAGWDARKSVPLFPEKNISTPDKIELAKKQITDTAKRLGIPYSIEGNIIKIQLPSNPSSSPESPVS